MKHYSLSELKIPLLFAMIFVIFANAGFVYAGPDGSGNNFFYKGPMAFSYLPPGKLLTEQAVDYQSFNSKFSNNGSVRNLGYNVAKYVYAPQLISTFKLFGLDNYCEAVIPFGKVLMASKFNHSRGGLDDPELYYGIFAYHYNGKRFAFDLLPQLSATLPYGNWNSSSLVNVGGDEWQFQPALTGNFGLKISNTAELSINYALGYSINKGHPDINNSAIYDEGFSYTNPGDDIFSNVFLNYIIFNKTDFYDEVSYVKQYDNYGYFIDAAGNTEFGYINGGYQDFVEGIGLMYHYKKTLGFDFRVLKDVYGKNSPDGRYSEFDVVYDFR